MFEKRIQRSIKLLDKVKPNWFNDIELNMANCFKCILGQLYGGYLLALYELDIYSSNMYAFNSHESEQLTKEWMEEIKRRRV